MAWEREVSTKMEEEEEERKILWAHQNKLCTLHELIFLKDMADEHVFMNLALINFEIW